MIEFVSGHGIRCPECEEEVRIAAHGVNVTIHDCDGCGWPHSTNVHDWRDMIRVAKVRAYLKKMRQDFLEMNQPNLRLEE